MANLKALVLAGGKGTRLRPLTHTSAKQLVPVANKPVLHYGLEAIAAAGITDVGIILGETGPEIRAAVGNGSQFGLNVTYIQQEAPLGLAHAVLIARGYLGDDDFVMYLGDNFLLGGITELVEEFRASDYDAQILLTQVADPRLFGVAELGAEGQVIQLLEKPEFPPSDLAVVGVYMFSPTIHEAVRAIEPAPRGELEITDAIQWMIDRGHRVGSHLVDGYWKDTGRLSDMLECNRMVLEGVERHVEGTVDGHSELIGRVQIAAGAIVEDSVIRGPVLVGPGTKIVRSYLGPFTSIAEECVVEDSELEYSIMLGKSSIRGVSRIENSLIGKDVEVTSAPRRPNAHQLMIGDHSRVQISQ